MNRRQSERQGVLVRLPEELKRAIVAEVARQGANMNDVCVALLAGRFCVPFRRSDRPCDRASSEALKVLLRMDRRLKRKIQQHALNVGSNLTDTVSRVLAVELGVVIDLPEPTRKTPFGGGPRRYRRTGREEQ